MKEKIQTILSEINAFSTQSKEELDQFRIKFMSKKGIIPSLFGEFKTVPAELRKEMGQALNALKNTAQDKFNSLQENLENKAEDIDSDADLTLPVDFEELGS